MAAYFLAPCLAQLRAEVNAAHPNRDKTSDGWVGDTAHAARKSDHNPDYSAGGIVRAVDIDHDGIDKAKLRQVACADSRTEYVIQDWVIYTRSNGFRPQKYTGTNGHTQHTHVSGRHGATYERDTRSWGYSGAASVSTGQVIIESEEEPLLINIDPDQTRVVPIPKAPAGKKTFVRFASDEPGGGVNIRVAGGWGKDQWSPLKLLDKVDGFTGWIFNGQVAEWDVTNFQVLSITNKGKKNPVGLLLQSR